MILAKILIFALSVVFAHVHVAPESAPEGNFNPININSSDPNICGGVNRQGFGDISPEPNNAQKFLRNQCHDETAENWRGTCSFDNIMALDREARYSVLGMIDGTVKSYLEEYFKDFLATELTNLGDEIPSSLSECIDTPNRRKDLHAQELQSSHEKENILSALVLNQIYSFDLERRDISFEPYMERLSASFPMLYFSKSGLNEMIFGHRGVGLRNVLREELGEDFVVKRKDGREHYRIMGLINENLQNNPEFKKKIDAAYDSLKRDYSEELKRRMEKICQNGMTPFQMRYFYRGVFDQAILDMTEEERATANFFLCRKAWYYQNNRTDSDCDGIDDSSDPDPIDPFNPLILANYSGDESHNPPYRSSYNYQVFKLDGELKLRTNLSVNFENLSDQEKTEFQSQLNQCEGELSQHLSEVFNSMKGEFDYYKDLDLKLELNFSFKENEEGDFNIQKCWCTDCYEVPDPDNPPNFIDRGICREDLSEAQKESVVAKLGSLSRWRNRADASHMLPGTDCTTMKHEILHRFGLPDEYTDTRIYPYNQVDCNIMGDRTYDPRYQILKPRQLQEILNPRFSRRGCN